MKFVLIIFLVELFFSYCLSAQDSLSISDFRYPETRAIDWKGSFSGSLQEYRSEHHIIPIPWSLIQSSDSGISIHSSSYGNAGLQSTFLYFHSKDNHDNSYRMRNSIWYNLSSSKSQTLNFNGQPRGEGSGHGYSFYGATDIDWKFLHYFENLGFHILGELSFQYDGNYNKRTVSNSVQQYSGEVIDKSSNLNAAAFGGLGYGRMRDGTFVAHAMRIIERLQEDGVITRQLTKNEIFALVNRLAYLREYTTNYQRHQKYLIRDIIGELEQQGVLDSSMVRAFSVMRIEESYREKIFPRLFGWRISYSVGGKEKQDSYERITSITTTKSTNSFRTDRVLVHKFSAESGYPISLLAHLYSNFSLELPARNVDTQFELTFGTSVIYWNLNLG